MTSLEITAMKRTAVTVVLLTASALAIPLMIYFLPLDLLVTGALLFMLIILVKMIYDSKLAELRREAESEYVELKNPRA